MNDVCKQSVAIFFYCFFIPVRRVVERRCLETTDQSAIRRKTPQSPPSEQLWKQWNVPSFLASNRSVDFSPSVLTVYSLHRYFKDMPITANAFLVKNTQQAAENDL